MIEANYRFKILNIENPVECRLLERMNRFIVMVRLHGEQYKAWINNTGRLRQFLVSGRKAYCLSIDKGHKTDFRLFAIEDGDSAAVIDTQLQMKAWEKSLEMGLIPWLQSCRILKRNARLGDSLIDYLLECQGQPVFLEAKSAVLRESDYAMYPDCPSARGRRHIRELTNHVRQGGRAIIMFIAALPDVRAFRPNRLADPELCGLLVEAQRAGVTLKSVGMAYCPEGAYIYLFSPDLKVELS